MSILFASRCAALSSALLLTAPAAMAQQKLTPGLWENSMTMKSAGGQMEAAMAQMQAEMAKMTPEKRKMMEEMMARQGMSVGGAGKPILANSCVTPEQAARDELPPPDGRCKHVSKTRSGDTMRFKFVCDGERKASGEGEFTIVNPKEHKGHVVVDTVVKGKPERVEMELVGRWLATDCGDVKPKK